MKAAKKIGRPAFNSGKFQVPSGFSLYRFQYEKILFPGSGPGTSYAEIDLIRGGATGPGVFTLLSFVDWLAGSVRVSMLGSYYRYSATNWSSITNWDIRNRLELNQDTGHNGWKGGKRIVEDTARMTESPDCGNPIMANCSAPAIWMENAEGLNNWPELVLRCDSINLPASSDYCRIEQYFDGLILIRDDYIQSTNFSSDDALTISKLG